MNTVIQWSEKSITKSLAQVEQLEERRPQIQATVNFLYSAIGNMYRGLDAARASELPDVVIEKMKDFVRPLRYEMKLAKGKLQRIDAAISRHASNIVNLRVFSILNDEQAMNHAAWLNRAGIKIPLN